MRQSGRFRLIAGLCALAGIAVLVLVLAGSGGKDATLVSGSALAQAANATERVPGATVVGDAKIEVEGISKPVLMHLHGTQDTRDRGAQLVGSYENLPAQVAGGRESVPVEIISIVPDVYMKSPLFGAALPSGKPWLHIDLAKTGRQLGIGDPTRLGPSDPSQAVQNLRAISPRVERLGSEDVRGVPTTHYRATVELRRLPATLPPARRAAARKSVARLIQLIGSDSYPLDAWIDRRHLVRRMRIVMKMKIQGQDRSMTQDITTELYDFGRKQKPKAPPAGETVDASQLSGAGSTP